MADEERMKILKMLEEGTIDVAEATQLLEAVGSKPTVEREPVSEEREEKKDRGELVKDRQEVEGRVEEEGELDVDLDLGNLGGKIADSIMSSLAGLGLGGSGYRFEEEVTGDFTKETVDVFTKTRNGRIEIKGWDKSGWKVILKKRIRATTEEKAEELAEKVAKVESGDDFLRVVRQDIPVGHSLRLEIFLPREKTYDLDLQSRNGRIVAQDLRGTEIAAETRNGRIVFDDVDATVMSLQSRNGRVVVDGEVDHLQGETRNGRIIFDGRARKITASTYNGRVILTPELVEGQNEYDLETKNGRVKLNLPQEGCGYHIQCETRLGKIKTELAALEVLEEDKGRYHHRLHAKTEGYDEKPSRAFIKCKTRNGNIELR